jgi:hypothetical protein
VGFQERRSRRDAGGSVIAAGERDERLFKVGCALWGKGEVGQFLETSRLLAPR